MELSILASTATATASTPASVQILDSTRLPPFGADFSANHHPRQYYYPSPPKNSDVRCVSSNFDHNMTATSPTNGAAAQPAGSHAGSVSPSTAATPKSVAFELLFPESPQYRARLPLRVSIFPHDTTDSIVTTVKNFYGLYSGPTVSKGVSFEDEQGNTLIARYENFRNNMIVYVRVIEEASLAPGTFGPHGYHSTPVGAQAFYSGDAYPLQAPQQQYAQHVSRPASRASRRRSPSPTSRGRRSASASTYPGHPKKARSRSSKNHQAANYDAQSDSMNGYSSGDGAPSSASGKIKDHLGNTEISVENIVEGGRRKRAKFESSELPLFAPPQMPAATSNPSVSPARRIEHHRNSMSFVPPGQNPFTHPRPLQSPQSYTNGSRHAAMYTTPGADARRTRGSIGYPAGPGTTAGGGILPTPDPTVGSCMSEEDKDVAIQLMRLGEMSNVSHGRTSASTLDDTFSGRADAASSTGATSEAESDSEDEMSAARRQKLDMSGNHKKIFMTTEGSHSTAAPHESVERDDVDYEDGTQGLMAAPKLKNPKPRANTLNGVKPTHQHQSQPQQPQHQPQPQSQPGAQPPVAKAKMSKPSKPKAKKPASISGPMSPASLPASRKPPIASNSTFPVVSGEDLDNPDLSSKPRCQRCRKSKKGCDRQRPCGRCRDAGIPAEFCISEDEGNGRKGRYGRHMGVPIKIQDIPASQALLPAAPITTATSLAGIDKNKKRKR